YPIIPCDLCGSQEGLQRAQVKKLLDEWEARTPGRRQIMFRALMNVRPSHLADPGLFDFSALATVLADSANSSQLLAVR
nr:tRNA 2-thiocytidine(32) synthetase TtcA [Tabrizicola sp.]